MNVHRRFVLVIIFSVIGVGIAQESLAQSAGAFSRLGFGARGMAMSNALIADNSGATSPYYNPALAPFTSRQNLQASVAFMTFDRQLEFLQFASPLPPVAGVAAGLIHASVSDIDGRSSSGFHTENFSTDEYAAFLAFGLKIGQKASMVFAPVVDVNNNPDNPTINIRSYGEDPELVGVMAKMFVNEAQELGMLTTLKHFPGHGNSEVDSHSRMGKIYGDRNSLNEIELYPYRVVFNEPMAGRPSLERRVD